MKTATRQKIQVGIIVILGIIIRLCFFNYVSNDYRIFLSRWMETMDSLEPAQRFALDVGDYTCPYLYVLAIISLLPVNRLYAVKLVSCFFDFALSSLAYRIIDNVSKSKTKALIGFGVILLCPTIIINSSVWGQCDVIYTFFVFASLLALLEEKPFKACSLFGLAFALKLQSVFFAPLLVCLWLKKKIKIKHLVMIPTMYVITCVPAILLGRNIFSTLNVYLTQSTEYKLLSANAASFLGFINDFDFLNPFLRSSLIGWFAVAVAGLFVLIALFTVFKSKYDISKLQIIDLACLFVVIIPFLLPRMHERYFYMADAISIIYMFVHKKKWIVPVLQISSSLYTYLRFLKADIFKQYPLFLGSLAIMAVIVIISINYYKDYCTNLSNSIIKIKK